MVRHNQARGQFVTIQSIKSSRFMESKFGQTRWSNGCWYDHSTKNQRKRTHDIVWIPFILYQLHFQLTHFQYSASPRKESNSPLNCDKMDDMPCDIRSIASSDLLPKSGKLVIHLQSIEVTEFDLELRHKFAQKCAVKEWLNTDIRFREMQAQRT